MKTPIEIARNVYAAQGELHARARTLLGRPLTLAEKILFAHRSDPDQPSPRRGKDMGSLHPDRVAMQDATAQMAILQFISAGLPEVALPTTVHCDHLIQARDGAAPDLARAEDENGEVYAFLRSAADKYGMGFWRPGSGIIHQVVFENYAFPGGLMIGTDSHTPNAGGLGMLAVGVGGADAVDAMVGMPWEVLWPKLIGVRLTGKLSGWTASKDVILEMLRRLTVAGGTGKIVEYFGPGAESLSCTGKGTITNMGAELGATTSVFAFDDSMVRYLEATGRSELAALCNEHRDELRADPEVLENPKEFYDEFVEIDLAELEAGLVGPHTPDLFHKISDMRDTAKREDYPIEISAALIGSCTNSSYEDLSRAAHIARQAMAKGIGPKVPFFVSPGSDAIQSTAERDGQLETLRELGATVLTNSCGPCIGQWARPKMEKGTRNSIVSSFNRNFPGRNDGNRETLSFLGSPELVTAIALSGRLDFDPTRDTLTAGDGSEFRLDVPEGPELPADGYALNDAGYLAPTLAASTVVQVAKDSERLALLDPFAKPEIPGDFTDMPLLLKAVGKCTTDHISPAGYWLRFRGHLDKISDNMFIGAVNEFTDKPGTARNVFDGSVDSVSAVARDYKARGAGWVVVGDSNYGEGSSREHAAMEPRWLGCKAVIVRSFARIHQTNLKKQGVLPLTFVTASDYDKIRENDRFTLEGLDKLAPEKNVACVVRHADGSEDRIELAHTMTDDQIEWFRHGSALEMIRANQGK
ncbi:MAG: aconitate hydratase [Planctomycetes bacterium]|nr:aconitate hydratase [Planctomycetota bacterium]